jgi:hypothetical protein
MYSVRTFMRLSIHRLFTYAAASFLMTSVSAHAQWWNPFSPSDYEECAASAAENANNRYALGILLSNCNSEFPARRKPSGGYHYYDSQLSRYFDVSGPKPSASDFAMIEAEKARLANQNRLIREKESQALLQLEVVKWSLACTLPSPLTDFCFERFATVEVKNKSSEIITQISFNVLILHTQPESCAGGAGDTYVVSVNLAPEDSGTLSFRIRSSSFSSSLGTINTGGCLGIENVRIR